MPSPTIPLHLYHRQAQITQRERTHVDQAFGELTPANLRSILDNAKDGDIEEWIELTIHMSTTDPKLFNKLDIRKRRVLSAMDQYVLVPGKSTSPASQAMAGNAMRFCDTVIGNIGNYKNKVHKMLAAIGQGVSATQLLWSRKEGANIIKDFEWAHARRFRWDLEWNLRLYDYGERCGFGEYGEELEKDCWLILVCDEDGTYPGEAGVYRKCAWPWNFKMWVNRFHIHATERYGQPFVTAKIPANSKGDTRQDVLNKLEQLSYDTVGVFEEGTDIVFEGGPSTVNDGKMFIDYLTRADECQAEAILGATDITDPGENGARAAVETRADETLNPKTITDIELLHTALQDQVFEPLLRYNMHLFGGILPPTPKYKHKSSIRPSTSYNVQGPQVNPQPTVEPTVTQPMDRTDDGKKNLTSRRRSHSRISTQQTFKFSNNPLEKALSGESVDLEH